ncbi:MAG: hypothetical protein IKA36_05685 [Clostridia bacterium]|nr:hypothetical protein [Clostridia bacterium]
MIQIAINTKINVRFVNKKDFILDVKGFDLVDFKILFIYNDIKFSTYYEREGI